MPTPRTTQAQAQAAVDLVNAHGSITQAARAARMPRETLQKRIDTARNFFNLALAAPPAAPVAAAVQAVPSRDDTRTRDLIQRLKRELETANRELNAGDDLREAVFRLAAAAVNPPAWAAKAKPHGGGEEMPILFASDFQWGEVINAREMDGINEFNINIARDRYRRLIAKTIEIAFHHRVHPEYPGVIYLRGGDMISGDIHQELRETNDASSIPAVLDLAAEEKRGILELKKAFGNVWVISVPGNHGRQTVKPQSKRYAETNYDYLLAMLLEREFANDPAVQFYSPPSGDALFDVFGYRFLLTHGDRIGSRGGQGFIGPAATISRGMRKLHDFYSRLGTHIDHILLGHFHTALELDAGFSNGSLPGYSEYARDGRMSIKPPEQWLLFVHPKHSISGRWLIALEDRPRMQQAAA